MRPFRSFLLLFFFLICFAGLCLILPGNINLPNAETFFPEKLLEYLLVLPDSNPVIHSSKVIESVTGDSAKPRAIQYARSDTAPDQSYMTSSNVSGYPEANSNSLRNVIIGNFLDSLKFSVGQIRVMYYGDSQIEGDRISSYLRSRLRNVGAGTGPGLFLPVMPVTYTQSVYIRSSANWKRYNYLSYKNGEISHNALGPFMAFCRYLPEGERSPSEVRAWVRIVPSKFSDSTTSSYDYLRILYRNPWGKVKIDVKPGDLPVIFMSSGALFLM
jgi:hypothetical protein